ncbi:hypothetical protein J2S40_003561 [Nocardioides luteus]|uniref:DUF1508 domain-containing protein n=1 Tax=Nocardioides luteus TaxID=1844 RepID=A0ABQ5SXK5_9ACTN|nr:hypothetical protein [Nocardioides luteus]MDR7312503.1 hypothetical protein [Nocardioides luteus]GLJ68750.1 hypothetical protein GCM10017579_27860 [Nocardioides luteus]
MLTEQMSIFDLIEDPTPRPAPATFLRELPAHYAKIATDGRPWHWMVTRAGHVLAAGHCKTQAEAEARTSEALAAVLAAPQDGAA